MEFITGALPNVMFIAGLIAIGLGLGIEFKIVETKGELSKFGRIAAVTIGAVLVAISVYLYTRPAQTAATIAPLAAAQPGSTQAATPAQPTATLLPTATLVPAATALPTTAAVATEVASVQVPDIRGQNSKDAQKALAAVGLTLGDNKASCAEIGAEASSKKLKRDQVLCQSPAPGSMVRRDSTVVIVLTTKNGG